MAASSVQDGHQAKAVGFAAANALTQHLPERFRVGHLQDALIGHRQQCDRPLSVLPEVTGLFPGHLKSALLLTLLTRRKMRPVAKCHPWQSATDTRRKMRLRPVAKCYPVIL